MIRRPPRSTLSSSSAASDVYKRQATSTAPTGWLLCDGWYYSRTTYSALYAVIGTTYGTTASTNFLVPDLTGRVIVGNANATSSVVTGGYSLSTLGSQAGNLSVTLSTAQMPSHTHTTTIGSESAHTHSLTDNDTTYTWAGTSTSYASGSSTQKAYLTGGTLTAGATTSASDTTGAGSSHTHTATVGSTGGNTAVAIMPPFTVLNYIIKT